MKIAAVAMIALAVLAGACRREAPEYVPMKLGADVARTPTQSR